MAQYRYLENLTYADAAFEVEGKSPEEVFQGAADALLHLMIEDLAELEPRERRKVQLKRQSGGELQGLAELLYEFLEKLVYWKDVDQLLLRVQEVRIRNISGRWLELSADLAGERIDPSRQRLGTDVKAITYHRLRVWQEGDVWKASVVVDV